MVKLKLRRVQEKNAAPAAMGVRNVQLSDASEAQRVIASDLGRSTSLKVARALATLTPAAK